MRNKTTFFIFVAALLAGNTIFSNAESGAGERSGIAAAPAVTVLANGDISVAESAVTPGIPAISGRKALSISRTGAASSELCVIVSDPALLGSPASVLSSSGERMAEIALRHVNHLDTKQWPVGSYVLRLVDGRSVEIACR